MSGPIKVARRPHQAEAMQIQESTTQEKTCTLDPNTMSIASISGWMLGHGFSNFFVCGTPPFGIKLYIVGIGWIEVPAGSWIVREYDGKFYACRKDQFPDVYQVVSDD